MKLDLGQVFLFGLFDVLGLFAVQLEILAHFVSPGTHPTPTSFSCPLVIVIWSYDAHRLVTTETNAGINNYQNPLKHDSVLRLSKPRISLRNLSEL